MKTIVYGLGGYDLSKPNNNIVEEIEIFDPPQQPLDTAGVIATLNVVLGLWSLQDAANAVGSSEQDLINEAQAWAVAETTIKP
jgi:hypothetical protein